jgi:hypothetical protein
VIAVFCGLGLALAAASTLPTAARVEAARAIG